MTRGVRPLALPAEPKCRVGGTSARPGAASPRWSSPCRWSGPRRAWRGFSARRRGAAGWRPGPRGWPGWTARARSRPGHDADLVAFAPDEGFVVDPARLYHRHPLTPYAGARLDGGGAADLAAGPLVSGDRPRRACCWPGGSGIDERCPPRGFAALPDLVFLPSARRERGVRHRRAVRREGEPDQAGAAVPAPDAYGLRGKVYDGWETQANLGARARPRDRPARGRPARYTAWSWTPRSSAATTRRRCRWRRYNAEGYPSPDELAAMAWQTLVAAGRRAGRRGERVPRGHRAARPAVDPRTAVDLPGRRGGPAAGARHAAARPAVPHGTVDLAALENGGRVTGCSDAFYASAGNLILPGRGPRAWPRAGRTRAGATRGTTTWSWRWPRPAWWSATVEIDTSCFVGNAPGPGPAAGRRRRGAGPPPSSRRRPGARCCRATRVQPDTRHRFRLDDQRRGHPHRLDALPGWRAGPAPDQR